MANVLLSNVSESIIELGNLIEQYMEEQKDSVTPPDFEDEEALIKYLSEKSGLTFCIDDMKKQQYESDIESKIYQITSFFQTIKNYEIIFAGIRNYYFGLKMEDINQALPDDTTDDVEQPPEFFTQSHIPAVEDNNPDAYGPA